MSCSDDDAKMSREDALAMLLSMTGIQEGRGWLAAVVPEPDGKLLFHYDRLQLPLHKNPYFPFPEHACRRFDKNALQLVLNTAWSKMAKMPFFASILMPAPTLATMLTGVKTKANIEELDNGIKSLDQFYADTMRERNMTPEEFYETADARKIIDMALMANAKRDAELRVHNMHVPISWDRYVTSVSIYLYYSRVVDILAATSAFTPQHAATQWHAQQKRIDVANNILFTSIDNKMKDILARPQLSAAISKALNSIAGSRFVGIDYDEVDPFIEQACIEFTYKVLAEMERWILTICGIPMELHEMFMCTAQPKIPLDAGELNEHGQHWQEDLRSLRQSAISSIWHRFFFDEEFNDSEEKTYIKVPHLSRAEYKRAVFNAVVRMKFGNAQCATLAEQRALTVQKKVHAVDLSVVYVDPIIIYDIHTGEPLDCEMAFRNV
jgi:hypothetical protein